MKPYSESSTCPKCGRKGATVKYERETALVPEGYGYTLKPTGSEVMHRTCERCGFEWDEAPLDAKPDKGTVQIVKTFSGEVPPVVAIPGHAPEPVNLCAGCTRYLAAKAPDLTPDHRYSA